MQNKASDEGMIWYATRKNLHEFWSKLFIFEIWISEFFPFFGSQSKCLEAFAPQKIPRTLIFLARIYSQAAECWITILQ